jgi:hypothetical protein
MTDGGISTSPKPDLGALLRLGSVSPASHAAFQPDLDMPSAEVEVSVAGVMVLTALSVIMAVFGVVMLALALMACWWVLIHIPVPPVVVHLLAKLGLATL